MRQLKITQKITNRDSSAFEKYLQEIAKKDMVTQDEEVELAQKIREWDQEALDRLVEANLRFVVSVAKQYQNQWLSLNELVNEGNVGLIKAAKKFDETRGFKFISYAVRWIRQSILHALATQGRMVRLPLNKIWVINKIKKTTNELEQILWRKPTNEELANVLDDVHIDEINDSEITNQKTISYDDFLKDDDNTNSYLDTMVDTETKPNDYSFFLSDISSELIDALERIKDKREIKILKMYYGVGGEREYSLEEIADEIGITRERVRQIKEKGIRKLRSIVRRSKDSNLKEYLWEL